MSRIHPKYLKVTISSKQQSARELARNFVLFALVLLALLSVLFAHSAGQNAPRAHRVQIPQVDTH